MYKELLSLQLLNSIVKVPFGGVRLTFDLLLDQPALLAALAAASAA